MKKIDSQTTKFAKITEKNLECASHACALTVGSHAPDPKSIKLSYRKSIKTRVSITYLKARLEHGSSSPYTNRQRVPLR